MIAARPVADLVIAACGGAVAAGAALQVGGEPLRDYGPLAVVVIMIGAIFKLANRITSIVDKRLGDLNTTIGRQGEQFLNQAEKLDAQSQRGLEMVSAAKEIMDVLRKAVEDAREDRRRLETTVEKNHAAIQQLLARPTRGRG